MKTIVVLSDTHNNAVFSEKFLAVLNECDYIVFLGDGLKEKTFLEERFKGKLTAVTGNCDSPSRDDKILEIEDVKIFVTHGHCYGVKTSLLPLSLKTSELNAGCAMFGHTHIATIENLNNATLINPGSFANSYEYAFVCVHGKKIFAKIVKI